MLWRLTSSGVKCHEILIKTFIHRKIGIRLLLRKFRKITNKPYFVLCQPTLVKIGRNLCYTQTWMETSYFEVVTVKNCWHYKPSLASFKKCQNKSSKLFWKVSSALISSWHTYLNFTCSISRATSSEKNVKKSESPIQFRCQDSAYFGSIDSKFIGYRSDLLEEGILAFLRRILALPRVFTHIKSNSIFVFHFEILAPLRKWLRSTLQFELQKEEIREKFIT